MSHVWIVEAKLGYGKEWVPVLRFGANPGITIDGVHLTRKDARTTANEMEKENWYNVRGKDGPLGVAYRAAKYVRED